ncbi:MAG TPA: Imm21 family immunity protein [Spirillospora sp.]|nr:Imm21 family immunity protein [Spirillospora sp.]
MIWVESLGGPLVALAESDLLAWSGIDGDYDRACAVDDLVGVVPVGSSGWALVLGDEPAGTTFVSEWNAFVRWLWAESGVDVAALLGPVMVNAEWVAGPELEVVGKLVLFDASLSGTEVSRAFRCQAEVGPSNCDRAETVLEVDLATGRYRLESAEVQPDDESRFRLHRLVPVVLG